MTNLTHTISRRPNFLLLAYSDSALKITLFSLVLSFGIALSALAIDATMEKAIPVAINWRQIPSVFEQPPRPPLDITIAFEWPEIENLEYSDYRDPLPQPTRLEWHGHGVTAVDANSAEEFVQKHLTKLKNIELKQLPEAQHWPVNCGSAAQIPCFNYRYIAYVHPFFGPEHFMSLWVEAMSVAFQAALYGIASAGSTYIFFDIYTMYFNVCTQSDSDGGQLLGELVTSSNPYINPRVFLFPFFASSFFLSLIIYMLALAFKFLTVLREGLSTFLGDRGFAVSERMPFTQASIVLVLLYLGSPQETAIYAR